jgi:RNA polymerase sigma-70 factor (ECF subfamily)
MLEHSPNAVGTATHSADLPTLIAQAQKNPVQFTAIYDRFIDPVYRYIYSRVLNEEDAEDLAALTFLSVLEALPRYKEQGQFKAWLFSIAGNKVIDHLRSETMPAPVSAKESHDPTLQDPLSEVIRDKEVSRLRKLIHGMNEERKELLRLRYIADLSFAEIGAILGRSDEAVKKAMYRVIGALQQQMEAENE